MPDNPAEDVYFTSVVFEEPAAGWDTPTLAWAFVGGAVVLAGAGLVLLLVLAFTRRQAPAPGGRPKRESPSRVPSSA